MDMNIMPKHVKLKYAVENGENLMKLKAAKILWLNAANARDLMKHDTTNAQSN